MQNEISFDAVIDANARLTNKIGKCSPEEGLAFAREIERVSDLLLKRAEAQRGAPHFGLRTLPITPRRDA